MRAIIILCILSLSGCVTSYQPFGMTGGYSESEIEPGTWRVQFRGSGATTLGTVRAYWLYRCASLATEKGFDGFDVLSRIELGNRRRKIELAASGGASALGIVTEAPEIEGVIRLLKRPFALVPGKVFDAGQLTTRLDPIVHGAKCDGNVCPHALDGLWP
jgi:hypothetical protein